MKYRIQGLNKSSKTFSGTVTEHLGEFPIGSYLKVTDSTKSGVTFLVLVRGIFSLYHLKAYVYSFILSRDSKFLGAASWLKMGFKSIFSLFLDLRPF